MRKCSWKSCTVMVDDSDGRRAGKDNVFCSPVHGNRFFVDSHRRDRKKKAVEFMGGKCIRCGFTGHPASYNFHHLDPSTKEFGISDGNTRSWEATVVELAKCVLLCANCHGEIHATGEEVIPM